MEDVEFSTADVSDEFSDLRRSSSQLSGSLGLVPSAIISLLALLSQLAGLGNAFKGLLGPIDDIRSRLVRLRNLYLPRIDPSELFERNWSRLCSFFERIGRLRIPDDHS